VRRPRAAQRAAAEQRASQVRAATTRATHDATRRSLQRRVPRIEDAGSVENVERRLTSLHVQLVALRPIEGAAVICPDLGFDAELAQKTKCAPGDRRLRDIEMNGDLATPA
jgi:hypothetical protein